MVQVEPCPLRTETTVLPEAKNTQHEPQRPQRSESVGRVGWLPRAAAPPAGHLGIILHWHVAS